MFTARRRKIADLKETCSLVFERSHEFGQGKALFIISCTRKTTEVTDRLEMDTPNSRGHPQPLPYYIAYGFSIDPSHESWDEHNADSRGPTICNGLKLEVEKRSSSQGLVYLIIDSIKLEKDR
jgi:hypothetical protein